MPLLLILLVPIAFGLNPVIARALAGIYEPGTLTLVRWLISALIVGAIAWARGRAETWRIAPRELPRLLFLGALGMGFCSFAAYAAVKTATATTVGLFYACTAAVVALYEIVRGLTRPSPVLLAGLLACISGVAVILTRGDLAQLASLTIGQGELWGLAGMLGWAGYTVAMKRQPPGLTPLALFTVTSVLGAVSMLPITFLEIADRGLPPIDGPILAWLAALVLISGVGAFLGYNWSMRLNGAVLTSGSICLVPLYIAGMAIVLIGEEIAWYHGATVALVVGGLGFINLAKLRAAKAAGAALRRATPQAHRT
jgi:drug/metabolite transporter (DMT)-like permease